jgi:CheY-like chemotaxis protein
MDLQMPVMDGLTAIRQIRALEPPKGRRTPVIVLSANAQSEHLAASAAAGADSHIAKPILAPTLIAALEAALDEAGEAGAEVA